MISQLKRDTFILIFTFLLTAEVGFTFHMLGTTVDLPHGFQDAHKEIIRGQRAERAVDGKMLAGSWRSLLRPVISRLVKAAPSSPLSSSLFGCFFAPGSPTDDRWSEGDRARSTRPDIIAPLLIDFCRVVFCANPTARSYRRDRLLFTPRTGVTTTNSKNRSSDYTPHESRRALHLIAQ